ncbi:MAG: hypothetical protein ACMXX9_03145 [Candidatus Woesearchaeota archaeon]
MSEKKEKSPEQKAAEKLAQISWDGKKADLSANYGSLRVLGEMAEQSVGKGTDPTQDKNFAENYASALIDNHKSVYGLDKLDNAAYYLGTGHGWEQDMIQKVLAQSIAKTGSITGGAIDAITQSDPRKQAMQNFSSYHLKANMPSEEELASAAKYIGLADVIDKGQIAREGGFKGLAGIVTGLAEAHKNGNVDEEMLARNLNGSNLGYLLNDKIHNKYFKKDD